MPAIVIAHTFGASRDTGAAYYFRDIFVRFESMRPRKQNLASALGIEKENWG